MTNLPLQPSTPISFPIKSLSDLESRIYFKSFHFSFNKSTENLPESDVAMPERRRILVCHDMMGGYVDDKWVQGGDNKDAYAIWHWNLMDVFVYFSHNLVTLPPPCWVNAAHKHGVKVLGTFIVEWDEGVEISKTLLATNESAQMYAERLADLALALGFDGWLLNMEVKLSKEQITILKVFISHLTQQTHSNVSGSLIIWYDSVTNDGLLQYQNQLNEKNKPFFDLCDGIFTNYTWEIDQPKNSAAFAGTRKYDVYMGIDVFGRGTYGGGQWNTNVALDLLKKEDISAAIFAPGWVYENLPIPDFVSNQNRWWGLVKESWGILKSYPKNFPFYSNFDQGRGIQYSIKGLHVAKDPWNNISCQGFQPLLEEPLNPQQATMQVYVNFEDESYSGGAKITCKGSLRENDFIITRLFHGQLPLGNVPVTFSYSVKAEEKSQMGLLLRCTSSTNDQIFFLLSNDSVSYINKLTNLNGKVEYVPVNNTGASWIIHEATITKFGYTVEDISLFCSMGKSNQVPKLEESFDYCASLGHISIQIINDDTNFPPANSWSIQFCDRVKSYEVNTGKLSLTIDWKLKEENPQLFNKYNIYVEVLSNEADADQSSKKFLGVARVERFHLSDFEFPLGVNGFKFIVQPCGHEGNCQELDDSPALILQEF